MADEAGLRAAICQWGRSLFERGLTSGSSGNISVRLAGGFLVTPTNSCLGFLDPDRLAVIDAAGRPLSGDRPSKEVPLHLALYEARPAAQAVVHLHSPYATALSCRSDIDAADAIPPLTPYVLMRAGRVPVIPYFDPGTDGGRPQILAAAAGHAALLLANHGPVVSGESLEAAVFAAEELEAAARLAFILEGHAVRRLDDATVARLLARRT